MNDFYTLYYVYVMANYRQKYLLYYCTAKVCLHPGLQHNGCHQGAGTLHSGNHVDTYYIVIVNLECSVEIFVIVQLSFAYLRHICLTMKTLISNKYLCWWTISPEWYHPPSSQCFSTKIVYQIYLLLKFTFPK